MGTLFVVSTIDRLANALMQASSRFIMEQLAG
jgi:hypothetical protein